MIQRALVRYFTSLLFALSLAIVSSPVSAEVGDSHPPLSNFDLAQSSLLGWSAIERRVRRGVNRGVCGFQFGVADRDEVAAIAMERAWQAYSSLDEQLLNPEAWGHVIAKRASLDELRRQKRDILRKAIPLDADPVESQPLADQLAGDVPDPLEQLLEAEKRALVRRQVREWPSSERGVATLILEGQAETVTAAAWLYRAEQDAGSASGTMYPQKAQLLLEARQREFEEIA